MSYNNIPPMPNKYLMPDGSIVTFSGAVVAPADSDRADEYKRKQVQVAKWMMPDGSIVSGIPMDMTPFEAIFVPQTTEINGHPLTGDINLTPADIGIVDPFEYKGTINCSANPNYPAADAGFLYIVSVAGKIGGASGVDVSINDKLWCKVDGSPSGTQTAVGANWDIIHATATGGGNTPDPTDINDVLVASGSPIAWGVLALADMIAMLEGQIDHNNLQGIDGNGYDHVPSPFIENDVLVASGSPIAWTKFSQQEFKDAFGISEFQGEWE